MHVQNGFFHFHCHDLTQICECDHGLLSKHDKRKNKRRFTPLLLMKMITLLLPILFLPMIQERFHWILIVGVTVRPPKSEVNNGIIMTYPEAPDEDVSSSLQSPPTLTYLLL